MRRTSERLRQRLSPLHRELGNAMREIDRIRRDTAGRTAEIETLAELRQSIRWAAVCLGVIHRYDPLIGETARWKERDAVWVCVPEEIGGETWEDNGARARAFERLRTSTMDESGLSPMWPVERYRALWMHADAPHIPAGMRLDEEMLVALALAGALELLRTLTGADADGGTK